MSNSKLLIILTMMAALTALSLSSSALAQRPAVLVTARNVAPQNGTFQTPIWVGFHGGTFDLYNTGLAASELPMPGSNAIESLAEDGSTAAVTADFDTLVPDGVQATMISNGPIPPLGPGDSSSMLFELDPADHRYFSYASMVIPSNDAFIANGNPFAHPIYDAGGNFVAQSFLVRGSEVLDAGTEENDELPANTAFFGQAAPNTGPTTPMGVVGAHPGFLSPRSGGILADPMFVNADFRRPAYTHLAVSFRQIDRAANFSFNSVLTGDQEVPATDSTAVGFGTLRVIGSIDRVRVRILALNLPEPLVAAHIHVGPEGQNGGVVLDLEDGIRQINPHVALIEFEAAAEDLGEPFANAEDPITAFLAAALTDGLYYNLHTESNPAGEIRGQIR